MNKYTIWVLVIIAVGCKPEFDRQIWIENGNSNHDNPRFYMVDDLEKNYLRLAMTREEIINLLGLPQYDTGDNAFEYQYEIGSNSGLHIDPYFFYVEFDSLGRLIKTRVEEH